MVDSKEGSREKVNRRGLTAAGKGRCDSIWGGRFQEREQQVQDCGRRHLPRRRGQAGEPRAGPDVTGDHVEHAVSLIREKWAPRETLSKEPCDMHFRGPFCLPC